MNSTISAFMQKDTPTRKIFAPFLGGEAEVPVFDYPISIRENFIRAASREDPMWVPNTSIEFVNAMLPELTGAPEQDWGAKKMYDWVDGFGCTWTFVPSAGGSMLKVGTHLLDDITEWDTKIKFPYPDEAVVKERCENFMATQYDPEKVIHINVGQGCSERLVAILGGYTEAMLAFAIEPEACHDFMNTFADYLISTIDMICKYIPIDCMTYHDDWGTEKDTFFSPDMMERIVLGPSVKVFSHIKKKARMTFHCCGRVERFLPYMCDLGPDFIQLQERANDMGMLKETYGDRIGFNNFIESVPGQTPEEYVKEVRRYIDMLGKGGGLTINQLTMDPEVTWAGANEIYHYSRKFYER